MNIEIIKPCPRAWLAYDADNYDGPGSPIGMSLRCPIEAVADLIDQIKDREYAA